MEPPILEGVIVEGDMIAMIPALRYVDHDIIDEKKFLELVPNNFLKNQISSKTHMIFIRPHIWDTRLQKEGILNLFDIPHFGRIQKINVCVKVLLSCVDEGYISVNNPIFINR